MLWIKEVEMVDSVDELNPSQSIEGHTLWTNLKLLDARIGSSLNNIIQNSYVKKVSLEEQNALTEDRSISEDRSLS